MTDAKTIDVTTRAISERVALLCEDYAADGALPDANILQALAADRDRLAAENERLREALKPFAAHAGIWPSEKDNLTVEAICAVGTYGYGSEKTSCLLGTEDFRRAREAIGES